MLRMLIVGYVFAIRSERLLCREVRVNLAYRWFCGLSIEDKVPDHSAFSRARHERFRDSDIFRQVFERVVEACIAAGLVGGDGFAVDASRSLFGPLPLLAGWMLGGRCLARGGKMEVVEGQSLPTSTILARESRPRIEQ
jgi:IS5 family transposase